MPHSKKDMPNPSTCEYDLIWKQGFCRYIQHIVQMYSRGGLGWVLIRGGDEDADTQREDLVNVKTDIYKPRGEASRATDPADTRISKAGLQN